MRYWFTIAAIALCGCTNPAPEASELGGFDPAELSDTVRPQDDYFAYVNQKWIDANPIPDEYSGYGVGRVVFERTEEQIRTLIEAASNETDASSAAGKIGALYASFLNEEAVEAAGLEGLKPLLAEIDAIDTHEALWQFFGRLQSTSINVPLTFYTDADAADPTALRVYAWQSGLGLPDRDYYLEETDKLTQARDDYRAHIAKMFDLAGIDGGEDAADAILALETAIATAHWSSVQNRDRQTIYTNKLTLEAADALTAGLSWQAFFEAAGIPVQETFVIAQTSYFQALPKIVTEHDVSLWQQYLKLHALKGYAPYLNQALLNEQFDFQGTKLRGQKTLRPRWKRGIAFVNQAAGELLGKVYVDAYFPESAKEKVEALVENLRGAFAASIDDLAWMSAPTKAQAKEKLAAFTAKLGYPDKWRDYSGLAVSTDDLLGNAMAADAFNYAHEVAKLSAPVDRSEWGMTPQTVNAYYRPTFNEIVFPAAILQPPFFDAEADDALNYGAIGAIIGHEFSHGFDDQGRKFDGTGRLRDWWQPEDAEGYESRAGNLVAQYAAFLPIPDTPINGQLTLGENIADLAGLTMAYRAYQRSLGGNPAPVINGQTGDERFFLSYARSWRGHVREQRLREILLTDPHSPGKYRVLGVLRNVPEFHDTYNVQPEDDMYLAPEARVRVW